MSVRPVLFVWSMVVADPISGEVRATHAMVPTARFVPLATRQFVVGDLYALGPVENVPNASRGGFFIAVREAWNSLPEDDDRFPSEEHLRKTALVRAGWATHSQFILNTTPDAKQMALGLRKLDSYAVITVRGNVVEVWTAKSIAAGQITAEDWKVVKPRALDFVASLAGTTRVELEKHSRDGGAR